MNFKDYSRTVGDNIRLYRKQKGLSQQELGDKIGKSRQHIGHIECGDTNPSLEMLFLISEALKVPVSAFLGDYSTKIEALMKRYKFTEKNDVYRLLAALDGLNRDEIDMVIKMIIGLKK